MVAIKQKGHVEYSQFKRGKKARQGLVLDQTQGKRKARIQDDFWSQVSRSVVSDSMRPMDCSLSGSSVHGIFQAIVMELAAISFSRGSSRPRNRTWVSRIAGRRFTVWATREAQITSKRHQKRSWKQQAVARQRQARRAVSAVWISAAQLCLQKHQSSLLAPHTHTAKGGLAIFPGRSTGCRFCRSEICIIATKVKELW